MPTPRKSPNTPNTDAKTKGQRRASFKLWREDLASAPAIDLRLARLALGVFDAMNIGVSRISSRSDSHDFELLTLLLPLLDLEQLAQWAIAHEDVIEDDTLELFTSWNGVDDFGPDKDDLKRLMRTLLKGPRTLAKRLARADDQVPVSATTRLLVDSLSLTLIDAQLLDYLYLHQASHAFRDLLRCGKQATASVNRERLASMFGLPMAKLGEPLSAQAPLRRLGLVDYRTDSDLEDYLRPSELLIQIYDTAPETEAALLALLTEPAPAAAWSLEDFPHLHQHLPHVGSVLTTAANTGLKGINALFYGAPGTGKTELARALAAAQELTAYQVKSSDEEGDGLSRSGRLSAYLMAQRLLAQRTGAVLIFDEVEDVFDAGSDLLAFLRPRHSSREKGWTNRLLEENPVPAIWITNDIEAMDPAFLRRFLLPVPFHTPPRSVRRQMAERHLGALGVSASLLDQLAQDEQLTPAQFGAAGQLVKIRNDSDPDAVATHSISAQRTLLHGAPAPRQRRPATVFDPALLNLAGEWQPGQLLKALQRSGRGSLCFYGPPGTGKTQFAEVLAEALDRELIARQASELISPYVGQTEQNLARLFQSTDPERSVLLLDEVDSFLTDRGQARHSWERTQVNELLQQLERYPGIFIAATNRMQGLDQAALRRFDFKLHFRALSPAQRRVLFAREVYGDAEAPIPTLIGRHLDQLELLTAGDVATVCRQRALLGEDFGAEPEPFLRRLIQECRLKGGDQVMAA